MGKLIHKDENGYERIVFAEVLIPDTPNTYGDFHTKESVREFAYGFMINGFGIDTDHDNVDVSATVKIIESFVARENDPDFIVGAWVLGMYIEDDDVWQKVLDGELNGYSYEAVVKFLEVDLLVPDNNTVYGTTEAEVGDGHTHDFFVLIDNNGRVIAGGTTETMGHSHTISQHTFTDTNFGHSHIFNITSGIGA